MVAAETACDGCAQPQRPRVSVPASKRRSDDHSRWGFRRMFAYPSDQEIVGQSEGAKRKRAFEQRAAAIIGRRHCDGQHAKGDEWAGSAIPGFLAVLVGAARHVFRHRLHVVGDSRHLRRGHRRHRQRRHKEPGRDSKSDQPVEDFPRTHDHFSHTMRNPANRRLITIAPDQRCPSSRAPSRIQHPLVSQHGRSRDQRVKKPRRPCHRGSSLPPGDCGNQ